MGLLIFALWPNTSDSLSMATKLYFGVIYPTNELHYETYAEDTIEIWWFHNIRTAMWVLQRPVIPTW